MQVPATADGPLNQQLIVESVTRHDYTPHFITRAEMDLVFEQVKS